MNHLRAVQASWVRSVEPAQEPVTLLEVKQHARILYNTDDAVLSRFIRTAREAAEEAMNRGLFTQTWQLTTECFAEVMYLPMAVPLQSATVQYYDTDGALQTLAPTFYTVDTTSRPGSIARAANQSWPSLQTDRRAPRVVVTYVVGWALVAAIPERIKQGIRSYVAYLDCDREGLEEKQDMALKAAQNCWLDKIEWIEPHHWHWYTDARRSA